jgi:hypothetical protein
MRAFITTARTRRFYGRTQKKANLTQTFIGKADELILSVQRRFTNPR